MKNLIPFLAAMALSAQLASVEVSSHGAYCRQSAGPLAGLADSGGFQSPQGTALDGEGNLYVADYLMSVVRKFGPQGEYLATIGSPGSGDVEMMNPIGVAISARGYVLVVDSSNFRVQVWSTDGTFVNAFGSEGSGPGEFAYPAGIAVNPNSGKILVADSENHRVQVFSATGAYETSFGGYGSALGEMMFPMGIAVDAANNIYVSEQGNNRIQKFDENYQPLATWNQTQPGSAGLQSPSGLAVDALGDVFVSNPGSKRVLQYDSSGAFKASIGDDQSLNLPAFPLVAPTGEVIVSNLGGPSILVFTACNDSGVQAARVGGRKSELRPAQALVAPSLIKRGEQLCLHLPKGVKDGKWGLYQADQSKVGDRALDGSAKATLEGLDLAPGVYFSRTVLNLADGRSHIEMQKVVVLP